jgi:hypothetical protein
MRRLLLSATFVLWTSAAFATCLTLDRTSNSIADFWVNHCNVTIGVTWSAAPYCGNYSCADNVGARNRQSTNKMNGYVQWRECQGGLPGAATSRCLPFGGAARG